MPVERPYVPLTEVQTLDSQAVTFELRRAPREQLAGPFGRAALSALKGERDLWRDFSTKQRPAGT